MRFHRPQRVASLIREKLSAIFLREAEFNGAMVTIIDVAVDDRLIKATVKIGVYPSIKGPDVLMALFSQRNKLQFLLSRKINIKPMPSLVFQLAQPLTSAQDVNIKK